MGSIDYLAWRWGTEFEIALTDGGESNFDQSFLHFNVNKKLYAKVTLTLNVIIEY